MERVHGVHQESMSQVHHSSDSGLVLPSSEARRALPRRLQPQVGGQDLRLLDVQPGR